MRKIKVSDLHNVASALPLPMLTLKVQLAVFVLDCLRKSVKIQANLLKFAKIYEKNM